VGTPKNIGNALTYYLGKGISLAVAELEDKVENYKRYYPDH
jgi:hypothetical protein